MSKRYPNFFISVIIPAYNEEKSLPHVLEDLPSECVDEIIVVNNKSTDKTGQVAEKNGCKVVFESRRGYGQACLAGMAALSDNTDIVVFIDGDYSDHGEQLPELLNPIIQGDKEMIIGSRSLGYREKQAMTPQAHYGNKLACFLMHLFWGYKYSDLGPFRAINNSSLKKLAMQDTNFGWTIEMQIKAVKYNLRIGEVPVNYRKRIGKSKISGTISGTIKAGYKILWTIFKYRFSKL